MKRRTTWIALLAALVVAVAAFWLWRGRAVPVDVVEVRSAPLVRTLQFSARVATTSRVNLGSTQTGRVTAVALREGARVQRGDVLVQLETDELRSALAQAVAAERQAAARVQSLRGSGRSVAQAQVAQAQATLQATERELARTQQLVAQGFVSAARLDDARKAVALARAQQDSARAQQQTVGDGGPDLALAEAQRAQAQAAVQAAEARLAQTTVRAPADGRVLTRTVEPGQIVQPGAALMSLALDGPTQLVAQVDERFLDQLQAGQPARVVADAFAGQPFAARVLTIAPAVDAQRGSVEVKLAPDGAAPAFLREDMTLSVEVQTGRRDAALVLPTRALRGAGAPGEGTVWVVQGGQVQARAIGLGLRTLDAVEAARGLAAGDAVVVAGDAAPGKAVRVRVLPWAPGAAAGLPGGAGPDGASSLTNAMGR